MAESEPLVTIRIRPQMKPARMGHKETGNGIILGSQMDEEKKITHLRALVGSQDPSYKDTDDETLRRFLRARDLDLERASAMLMDYLRWRRTYVPNGFFSATEVLNQIAQNKAFMQGTDKRGCPVLVVFASRHFTSKAGTEEFKRFVVFVLDSICSRLPEGQKTFTIIGNLQGYGYSNSDVHGYIAALSILQNYYPERLRKLFLVHAPYIFMALYKIVYPFIDKRSREKITFVENKKLKATLLEEIDESQLPEIYGGKLQLVPIQDA